MEKAKAPAKKKTPESTEEAPTLGVQETEAKAIAAAPAARKPRPKKLAAKGKHRLPRKLKKRLKKESQKSAAK
jgi:hypothetical protein